MFTLNTPIYIIGSGNVAWNLTKAFKTAQISIRGIWSRNHQAALEISQTYNIPIIEENHLSQLDGIFILAVSDAAIEKVAKKINHQAAIIHTSGSTPIDILTQTHHHAGVFYPLQTFSKHKNIAFNQIPILIEYSNDDIKNILENWTTKLQTQSYFCTSADRIKYHIAAVFACNFVNHMIAQAEYWLEIHQLRFDLLKPLIAETIQKAMEQGARQSQTGPAIRNDQITIEKHLKTLEHYDELKNLYSFVTQSIISKLKKE